MRVQPRTNEFINEEWISDKTRYAVDGAPPAPHPRPLPPPPPLPSPSPDPVADPAHPPAPFPPPAPGLKQQRLDTPLLRKDGKLTPVGWPEALEAAAGRIGAAGGAVGAFAGPLVSVEALACAKQLLNMLGSTTTKACTDLSADLRAGCPQHDARRDRARRRPPPRRHQPARRGASPQRPPPPHVDQGRRSHRASARSPTSLTTSPSSARPPTRSRPSPTARRRSPRRSPPPNAPRSSWAPARSTTAVYGPAVEALAREGRRRRRRAH